MSRTATGERLGGAAAWSPSVTPPIGVDLDDRQALACAFRILARVGFSENIAGHITWRRDDGRRRMWVNPWGLWWDEVQASDVCAVDPDAERARGPVGRHPGDPHPHRAAPRAAPTPASSCTTTRTT